MEIFIVANLLERSFSLQYEFIVFDYDGDIFLSDAREICF